MAPLLVLVVGTLALRLAGSLGVDLFASWQMAARYALAAMFLLTATAHFNRMREDLVRMVPEAFPAPGPLVTVTGVLEFLGAVGLLWPATAKWAGLGLALLMVALLPANVSAARRGLTLRGKPVTPLRLRVPMQAVFIAVALWSTW